jgi:hypothetical protein
MLATNVDIVLLVREYKLGLFGHGYRDMHKSATVDHAVASVNVDAGLKLLQYVCVCVRARARILCTTSLKRKFHHRYPAVSFPSSSATLEFAKKKCVRQGFS